MSKFEIAEFIDFNEQTAILNPTVSAQIADLERKAKEIKEAQEELKAKILEEMELKHILSLETNELKISYVGGSDRETFDSKQLRADNPDLYDQYVRMSPVKASVRIKLK